jgi:phosphoglycerate dehydrogenase-like enzyme
VTSASGRPLRVCLAPDHLPWHDAVRRGGGEPVTAVDEADALIFAEDTFEKLGEMLRPNIRWVFLGWSGTDGVIARGLVTDERKWSSARGLYGVAVAEQAMALLLAGTRCLGEFARAGRWTPPPDGAQQLEGKRALVIGAGDIGQALIPRLKAFDVDVTMLVRTPRSVDGADSVITGDQLHQALPEHHYVLLALSLTAESRHLIGATELGLMRPDAWLVNVARGAHVDTDSLVDALRRGLIGGAALDVTDPEPLPDEHPLWTFDNVIISPHTACPPSFVCDLLTDRIEQNVRRFSAGEDLISEFSAPSDTTEG